MVHRGGRIVVVTAGLALVVTFAPRGFPVAQATGLVLIAADLGGRMVYGPNYLPF